MQKSFFVNVNEGHSLTGGLDSLMLAEGNPQQWATSSAIQCKATVSCL